MGYQTVVVRTGSYNYVIGAFGHYGNICRSPNGKYLYIAYSENTESFGVYNTYVVRSTDNGVTWDTPVLVQSDGNSTEVSPVIACLPRGRVVVIVWDNTLGNLYSYYSDDNGATFSSSTRATLGTYRYRPAVCATSDGRIYVISGSGTTSTTYIYLRYSTDGTWSSEYNQALTSTNYNPWSVCAIYYGRYLFITWNQGTNVYRSWWNGSSITAEAQLIASANSCQVITSSRSGQRNGHLVYVSGNYVYYNTIDFSTETLGTPVQIMGSASYATTWPTIYEDYHGNLFVFACGRTSASGTSYYIRYVEKPLGGSWTSEADLYTSGDCRFPKTLQSTYPVRSHHRGAGQLSDGACVCFYDLTNKKMIYCYRDNMSFVPMNA